MSPALLYPTLIIAQLVVLYVLSSRTNGLLYRKLGQKLYLLTSFPGVVVHELSHFAACVVTFTKVRKVRLFEPSKEGSSLVLGYVEHDRTVNPFASLLIGAAPFFGGAAVLWLVVLLIAPAALEGIAGAFDVAAVGPVAALSAYGELLRMVVGALAWDRWQTYVLLYVLLSISTHIAPSAPDLKHAIGGAAVLAVAGALVWYGMSRYGVTMPFDPGPWAVRVGAFVSAFLTLGIAVAGTFALLLHGLVWLFGAAFGRMR